MHRMIGHHVECGGVAHLEMVVDYGYQGVLAVLARWSVTLFLTMSQPIAAC